MNINPNSPRQKMINLMYIVLMALLALNVSSDVLNGFSLVDKSLQQTTDGVKKENASLMAQLEQANKQNPIKIGPWLEKAKVVRERSESLCNYIDSLKWMIAREADGKNADVNRIIHRENQEATSYVMLSSVRGQGQQLKKMIDAYRQDMVQMINNPQKRELFNQNLCTEVTADQQDHAKDWVSYSFENKPVMASMTLLSKLQNDVRYVEGEMLQQLYSNTDVNDVRVNQLQAYVLPSSDHVMRGSTFNGHIILAAVDSTRRPDIYVEGRQLKDETGNGYFELPCSKTGDFTLKGHLELKNADGETIRRDFEQPYTVVEPAATVSATMMNVLYAGYDNPLSISVPGISPSQVSATMTGSNGTLKKVGNGYVVHPLQAGHDVSIRVMALVNNHQQSMGEYSYRVRQLPDPAPFIEYTEGGTVHRYRGGQSLAKATLLNAPGIVAAIDDGLLNISFNVKSFETVFFDNMGNAVPEVSNGPQFSSRQKEMFRRLTRGRRFYISHVKAQGPDGIERLLNTTLEVIVK